MVRACVAFACGLQRGYAAPPELVGEHQAARATADDQDLGGLRKHPEILERLPKGLADPGELSALTRRSGNPSCDSYYKPGA
jgi:hypothetical protein